MKRHATATRARFSFRRDRLPAPEGYYVGRGLRLVGRGEWRSEYRLLRAEDTDQGPFRVRLKSDHVQTSVPYVDTGSFILFARRHGLPVLQNAAWAVPFRATFDRLIRVEARDVGEPSQNDASTAISDALGLCASVYQAFGVPPHVIADAKAEIVDAANRAADTHRSAS